MSKVSPTPTSTSIGWVHFDATRWALGQMARTDITPLAKLVLFAMAAHVRDDHYEVWPSQDRIALLVGASRHGVRLAIESLVAAKLVEITKADGMRVAHTYKLRCEDYLQRCRDRHEADVDKLATKVLVQPELLEGETTRVCDADPVEALQAVWNENRGGLPGWRHVSPDQQRAARARLKELPLAKWAEVVRVIAASTFCRERSLGPSFLLRQGTWSRALNGEIAGWGKAATPTNGRSAPTAAQATQRAIDASYADGEDNLAEALRIGRGEA